MKTRATTLPIGCLSFAAALSLATVLAPARTALAEGIQVGLTTPSQTIAPSTEFDVTVSIPQAGTPFNAFRIVVGYDPAALTFIPSVPVSAQQGCLMTGACSSACGTTWCTFTSSADSLVIDDYLMCDLTSIAGPGSLYRLHFRTSGTPQTTFVRIRRAGFYNAGLRLTPVSTADRQVDIGSVSDVAPEPSTSNGLRLGVEPNPARGPVTFAIETDEAGRQRLEVVDLAGRMVRRLSDGWQSRGTRRVTWDGADASGRRLPPGVYLVRVLGDDRNAQTRVALLR